MIEEEQIDLGDVADKDEVALLLAGTVAVAALEQLDLAFGAELVEVWKATDAMRPLCDSRGP
jgi:molybdopterin-binding protein